MKQTAGILFLWLIVSCNSQNNYSRAENAQDAGREFIRASLDGNYRKAKFFLFKDSTNLMLIEQQRKNYNQLNGDAKALQRDATIRPVEIKSINDSTTTYKYFNTYNQKDTTTFRVLRVNGEWLVDLKTILKE